MGLFDTFKIEGKCVKCGKVLDDWQSKDLDCLMNEYQIGDKVSIASSGAFSGIASVHAQCAPPGLKIFDFVNGSVEYIGDEDPEEYCKYWNDGLVCIHDGIVKRLRVLEEGQKTEDEIVFESFICSHYEGDTEGLAFTSISTIKIWKENNSFLIKDEKTGMVTQGSNHIDSLRQLADALELEEENG